MCFFVTIGVPRGHESAVERLGRQRGVFSVERSTDPLVTRLFTAEYVPYTLTRGGCSCGMYSDLPEPASEEPDVRQRERYRRMGWSEAKIARALESRRSARGNERESEDRVKFRDAIVALVEMAGSVLLLAQWVGNPQDAPEPRGRQDVTLERFVRDRGAFPAETVACVSRGSPAG